MKAAAMASSVASFSPLASSAHSLGVGATTGVTPTPMPVMLPSLCDFGPFNETPAGRKVRLGTTALPGRGPAVFFLVFGVTRLGSRAFSWVLSLALQHVD